MEIRKSSKDCLELIWKNKISLSKTKVSTKDGIKQEYITYRTIFPLSLYNFLDYDNKSLYICKLEDDFYEIKDSNQCSKTTELILKNNNSNYSKTNNSAKRMALKKSYFGKHILEKNNFIEFKLLFDFKIENYEQRCFMKFICD